MKCIVIGGRQHLAGALQQGIADVLRSGQIGAPNAAPALGWNGTPAMCGRVVAREQNVGDARLIQFGLSANKIASVRLKPDTTEAPGLQSKIRPTYCAKLHAVFTLST